MEPLLADLPVRLLPLQPRGLQAAARPAALPALPRSPVCGRCPVGRRRRRRAGRRPGLRRVPRQHDGTRRHGLGGRGVPMRRGLLHGLGPGRSARDRLRPVPAGDLPAGGRRVGLLGLRAGHVLRRRRRDGARRLRPVPPRQRAHGGGRRVRVPPWLPARRRRRRRGRRWRRELPRLPRREVQASPRRGAVRRLPPRGVRGGPGRGLGLLAVPRRDLLHSGGGAGSRRLRAVPSRVRLACRERGGRGVRVQRGVHRFGPGVRALPTG